MVRSIRPILGAVCALAALVGAPAPAYGQDANNLDVRWEPFRPRQGSFIYLVVRFPELPDNGGGEVAISGSLAGQPLSFEVDRRGEHRALAAVPVNAQSTIPLSVSLSQGGNTSHRFVRIPVDSGNFESERLSVDPRFSRAPDSALAARIRRESAQSRAVSQRAHDTPRLWHGDWVRPRPGRITSSFGTARVFNGEVRSRHMGTDLDGNTGDPIRASNRAVVALVGDFYYAGNVVYLDHGAGLVTIYMHMSEVSVDEGEIVERGQVIGKVGATGRVTGPHVHWVGRYGRVSVDPLTLFELDPTVMPLPIDLEDAIVPDSGAARRLGRH